MGNAVYYNPVFAYGADPWITLIGGKYYATMSGGDEGLDIYCAASLAELGKSQPVRIFSGEPESDHRCQFWAPEIHRLDGAWYCYFTASDGDRLHHKMFALRNCSENLLDKWEFIGAVTDEKDGWCIDATVFTHKNRRYMVYAHGAYMGEELVIRPMLSPEKLGEARTVISHPAPEEKWINEGPFQLKTAKHDLLIFSTHQSHTGDYQLDTLELTGDDPMDEHCWKRIDHGFMTKSETEFGPGHCTFFTDAAGDVYVAMQTMPKSGTGWEGRTIWVQKLLIDDQGYPSMQHPNPVGEPQTEPLIK